MFQTSSTAIMNIIYKVYRMIVVIYVRAYTMILYKFKLM